MLSRLKSFADRAEALSDFGDENYDSALAKLDSAISTRPSNYNAHRDKARCLMFMEKYEDAMRCVEVAIQLAPKNSHSHFVKGQILYKLKKFTEALDSFNFSREYGERGFWKNHNKAIICEEMGDTLAQLKRNAEALKEYSQAIELTKNPPAHLYLGKGKSLFELGRNGEALESLEKVIGMDKRCAEAYYFQAKALSNLERTEEAKKAYEIAASLDATYQSSCIVMCIHTVIWDNPELFQAKHVSPTGEVLDHFADGQ